MIASVRLGSLTSGSLTAAGGEGAKISINVRPVQRLFRRLLSRGLRRPLAILEERLIAGLGEPSAGPIFVTGVPRSGTTLLYQCLISAFNFSYFTNLASKLAQSPVLASYIVRMLPASSARPFASQYGETHGLRGPSEGYLIMNRWFARDHGDYLVLEDLSPEARRQIRRTIVGVEAAFGGTFINKNVKHGVRLRALAGLFPKSVFVVIRRDHLAVAQSILHGRMELFGSKDAWFSVKPRGWESCLNEGYISQVCKQITMYEQDLERDSRAIGRQRFALVDYEQLCANPRGTVNGLGGFLSRHGIAVTLRRELPASFPAIHRRLVDESDYRALEEVLAPHGHALPRRAGTP